MWCDGGSTVPPHWLSTIQTCGVFGGVQWLCEASGSNVFVKVEGV